MKDSLAYLFRPDAQAVLDHFCGLFGIRIAFSAVDGTEALVGRAQGACDYCRGLRTRLGLEERCRESDRRWREEAERTGGLVSYVCHGGLTEAILPVRFEEKTIGFVMIGQVRCEARLPARYAAAWRKAFGDDELADAFQRVPTVSREQMASVLGVFRMLVDYIVSRRLVEARGDDALAPLLARMRARPEERLSLGAAARLVHRSPSTLSHLFRKLTGRSFQQTRTELALEKAERLLATVPGLTVREAAARAGFDDALYFSRLFRRHRGRSPGAVARAAAGGFLL